MLTIPQEDGRSGAADYAPETRVTQGPGGRILTNTAVWSPDGRFIVYDTRSDVDGTRFDGNRIDVVDVESGQVQTVYTSRNGAYCGVATFHPTDNRVVFIVGPENPSRDWQYGPAHRQGVMVDLDRPDVAVNLDARDLTPPFTPGALRGGSHVHVYSPEGEWVSFTYNDAVLSGLTEPGPDHDIDQRNIGVSAPFGSVTPPVAGRNHSGTAFSVLVTRTTAHPTSGSDEIQRAFEEGWVGSAGYRRPDGARQKRALAFLGEVIAPGGGPLIEVFLVDLPDDLTVPGDDGPLEGTATRRPAPPRGTAQRRLTFTADRRFPGVQGPRHWVRSPPDGSRIAFLMRDDAGAAQIWTVPPAGGAPQQVTRDAWGVASAFSWSPGGRRIAYTADNSVFVVEAESGESRRLTPRSEDADAPLPLACVFSPDGRRIAFLHRLSESGEAEAPRFNQICVLDFGREVVKLFWPPSPRERGLGGQKGTVLKDGRLIFRNDRQNPERHSAAGAVKEQKLGGIGAVGLAADRVRFRKAPFAVGAERTCLHHRRGSGLRAGRGGSSRTSEDLCEIFGERRGTFTGFGHGLVFISWESSASDRLYVMV